MAIITGRNLRKIYKTGIVETEVIKNIDLDIQLGEFTTITGPSGSGKSTLLYLLSGMEPLSKGEVIFNDENLSEIDDSKLSLIRRKDMAFVFQFYNLLTEMNVTDNVLLPSLINSDPLELDQLKKVLDLVGLDGYEKHYPYELSGGQQQRVAVARAFYGKPKVIFADEPTGNLDSVNGKKVMDIFKRINEESGITIVMVTHSEEYANYGTRRIRLKDGEVC